MTRLCGMCESAEATGSQLFLFGYGVVCYFCSMKGSALRKQERKVAKNRIIGPKTKLVAFGVKYGGLVP